MFVCEKQKEKVTLDISAQTVEEYIKGEFTCGIGESRVKHCLVGENRFRINFYTIKNPGAFVADYGITRSHYVICTKTDDGWSHRIWADDDKRSFESDISKYL
jgi:hypothetical protein